VSLFTKATKHQLKARVAFAGPTGSGKTYSALEWAQALAQGERVAVVDTEHGSASLYADVFDFDVHTWAPPYDPGKLAETIVSAEREGYAVIVLDSMSHFWEGEGGTLDIADAAGQRSGGNSFAGWKVATPALRHLIDTMLGCDMHVIGTMRSKMEYVLEEDSRGKKIPKKVGMAPVMRAGVEYEFTMVGDIDLEHRILFTKSRCSELADVMVQPGRAGEAASTFLAWLQSGDPALVLAARAKKQLVEKFGKEQAIELWGDRGSSPIDPADLADLLAFEGAPPAPSAGDGACTAPTPVPVAGIPVEPAAPAAVAPGHNPATGNPGPDLDDAA
jgi:hypothetical protein